MISKQVYTFLETLQKNNNRGWFLENKKLYEQAKIDFEIFTNTLINEIRNIDNEVGLLAAKDCIFRIFRDVRFSKDKSPYKTNFGAFVVKGGRNSGYAGYYVHIEPKESFLAGGIYMPLPTALNAVREEIYDNIDEFKAIIQAPSFIKHFKEISGDKLKTAPKGFPKDFPDIDLLKFKSYTVFKPLTRQFMQGNKLLPEIREVFTALHPFNQFINKAIG